MYKTSNSRNNGTPLRVVFGAHLVLVLALLFVHPIHALESYQKPYLTWQGNPSTTMTITYHSAEAPDGVEVVYDVTSAPETYTHSASGASFQIPGLPDGRHVNSVELTGLQPGATYYFRLKQGDTLSEEYAFRTIPDSQESIRFAIGGDTLATRIFQELLAQVTPWNPHFLVVGGDLAYADGDVGRIDRWNKWFEIWHQHDTTADGRLIPLVMAIGNHETNKKEGTREERAPFLFGFFPQGGETYFSHRFGPNLGMIILDSNHLVSHEEQCGWLEEQLKAHKDAAFRTAVYHVPLYPSHRDYEGGSSVAGRTHWLPLFDAHGLDVGFEHHDHTFKRTKRLRNNEVNPAGTLYVGDGNAGVPPRTVNENLWYMEKVSRESHFWIVDVSYREMHLRAVNRTGEVFDETRIERANAE